MLMFNRVVLVLAAAVLIDGSSNTSVNTAGANRP